MKPELWRAAAPVHFDSAWPRWLKLGIGIVLLAAAFFVDQPIAEWAIRTNPLGHLGGDVERELTMLEQFGQWTSSVLIILALVLVGPQGRRRALAVGLGCLFTVVVCYLLKDICGRPRPDTLAPVNAWYFAGPAMGFSEGSKYGAFPSAHTTGAFALACGLSWFYPRGRGLFIGLACITAGERVLHHAHYLSDVIAGAIVSVCIARFTLSANFAGKLIAALPQAWQAWWLADSERGAR